MWKQRIQMILWCVFGAATVILLVAAMENKEHKTCSSVDIAIKGADDNVFVNKKNTVQLLDDAGAVNGNDISTVDFKKIEDSLEKNAWIKSAELFFDNNQVLHANITEREPLARIFTLQGTSFYIDSSGFRLPLSNGVARVPVFTSFPSANKILAAPDSAVLQDVKKIAQYIQKDSFWMAQVAQVDITPQRTYEIIPVLGNQVIKLGDAENLDEKFLKLFSFYKQVWSKYGFEKYETIDVQYEGQVVAVRRGAVRPAMDSAKAMQVFGNSANMLAAVLKDTTYSAPVIKKDTTAPVQNKMPAAVNTANPKTTGQKKSIKPKAKPAVQNKKPKAVLPKKVNRN